MKSPFYYSDGKQLLYCFSGKRLFLKINVNRVAITLALFFTVNLITYNVLGAEKRPLAKSGFLQTTPCLSINDITVTEGNSGTSVAQFEVTLNHASTQEVRVNYWPSNSTPMTTATSPTDYTSVTGTLIFAPGETSKTIDVPIKGDKTYEGDQDFYMNLSGAKNATLCTDKGKCTIKNDDQMPTMAILDTTIIEGNTGQKTAYFLVQLNDCSDYPITFDYSVSGGSATADEDFVPKSGTLTISPTKTARWVMVPVLADQDDEDDEDFYVTISNATNATIIRDKAKGLIVDDDDAMETPILSIDDVNVNEGDGVATFTLSLSSLPQGSVTVDYATANGTATSGSDYTAGSGTLTFPAGETTITVDVPITDDNATESTETFFVNISNAANATVNDAQARANIFDNDAVIELPFISIGDFGINEADGSATITVSINKTSEETITVDYATASGTAISGTDFTAASGTLTFAPGETSKTFTVTINVDDIDESNENFLVNLTNASNADLPDNQGNYTIIDDDETPTLSINNVSVAEGNEGTQEAELTITLSTASSQIVTVDWATQDNSAVSPDDYNTDNGSVSFGPGETSKIIVLSVKGDAINEGNESFLVNLTNATGEATIADNQGVVTITDDDQPLPAFHITDVTVTEGNSGTVTATFTVTLDAAAEETATVNWATQDDSATEPDDYVADNGTLTFAPGETSKTIQVTVNGDTQNESGTEYFWVNLSNNSSNTTIADTQGWGGITDDDEPLPALSVNNTEVAEGNSGTVTATFTVTLDKAGEEEITVDYQTVENSATSPEDYTAKTGTLTFAPGELSKTVTVSVIGDVDDEGDHGFYLQLINPSNADIADEFGFCTIHDDDQDLPAVRIYDTYVYEGNDGTAEMTIYIYLDKNPTQGVTLNYATEDVSTTEGDDYEGVSGSLTFSPGETYKSITVTINGDTDFEGNEQFRVNLTNVQNATVNDGQGSYVIYNDDNAIVAYISDYYLNPEGDSGTKTLSAYVYLNAYPGKPVTLDYALANGTATSGNDYETQNGTLEFATNEYYKVITITIDGDETFEPNEFFRILLSNPVNALITDGEGIVTIYDDDAPVQLYLTDTYISPEGDSGSKTATVYAYLTQTSDQTISVNYATSNANATSGSDYTAQSGSLTFSPGEYYKQLDFEVLGDNTFEPNEIFKVNLSNPVNATIYDANGIITIYDDDATPYYTVNNTSGNEGGTATFTVFRSVSTGTSSVDYATVNGQATSPADYTAESGTLTFSDGEYYKMVTVNIATDNVDEPYEYFFLRLSNPSTGTVIQDLEGSAYINGGTQDYNYLGVYGANDYEGDSGTKTINFTIYLTRSGNNNNVTVNYTGRNITASSPSDFTAFSGSVTFSPNEYSKTIPVTINGDNAFEMDETFGLTLSSPTNASLVEPSAVSTIYNDDNIAIVNVYDITVTEGDNGTDKTATVGVYLAPYNTDQSVTVNYTTANGTAVSGSDYDATSGTLTFAANDNYEEFTVTINGDNTFEPDEYFRVLLSSPTNAVLGDADSYVKITDNDLAPYLFVSDATITEGDSGSPKLSFYVYLNVYSDKIITVDYTTQDVTANTDDYTTTSGTLTFNAVNSHLIEVPVNPDLVFEPTEYLSLVLSNPENANIGDGIGTGTITDDDNTPIANIYDSYVYEGNSGETAMYFGVYLNQYSDQTITIDYTTANGTASSASDFTAVSGTLTFSPYETYKYVLVNVQGDTGDETNETFTITLSNPENVLLGDAQATGTIYDDDAGTSFSPVTNSIQSTGAAEKIANIFTPNGDGYNDRFKIEGIESVQNEVVIMNRQGVQLFKQQNYKNDWDGTGVEDGTYFYMVKTIGADGKAQIKKGYITLLRQLK